MRQGVMRAIPLCISNLIRLGHDLTAHIIGVKCDHQ